MVIRTPDEYATTDLAHQLNVRLGEDRALTNNLKYGRRALPKSTVLNTWSGTLRDEPSLPGNWLHHHKGVLVGITPRRANGRNR